MRLALLELVSRHVLDAALLERLQTLAGLRGEPSRAPYWLGRVALFIGCALGGFGALLWVAANWAQLAPLERFALLELGFGLACAVTLWLASRQGRQGPTTAAWPAAAASGLLVWLLIGALLAAFGQTYQTGADPWQLFALWAALGLPLALGLRHDVVWMPWVIVSQLALSLWFLAYSNARWWSQVFSDPLLFWAAWALLGLQAVWLSPLLRRWTGAGVWSYRLALVLGVAVVCTHGLAQVGMWDGLITVNLVYVTALMLLLGTLVWFSVPRHYDGLVVSTLCLAMIVLLLALVLQWLGKVKASWEAKAFMLGCVAAVLLALASWVVLRLHQRQQRWLRVNTASTTTIASSTSAVTDGTPAATPTPVVTALHSSPHRVWHALLEQAHAQGWLSSLPEPYLPPMEQERPWHLVLLGALGAWLVSVPFAAAIVIMLVLGHSSATALIAVLLGLGLLLGAALGSRWRTLPLLLEQMLLPAMLTGTALSYIGLVDLMRQYNHPLPALLLAALTLGCGLVVRPAWLRLLLGLGAAVWWFIALDWLRQNSWSVGSQHALGIPTWLALEMLPALLPWLGAIWWLHQPQSLARWPRWAVLLETLANGWLLGWLGCVVWVSGQTYLLSGLPLMRGMTELRHDIQPAAWEIIGWYAMAIVQSLMVLATAAWWMRMWPSLQRLWCAALLFGLAVLAAFMPLLVPSLLAGAVCLVTRRKHLALVCAVAVGWIVGSLYYQLRFSLTDKAMLLLGLAVPVVLLAAWGLREVARTSPTQADLSEATLADAGAAPRREAPPSLWQTLRQTCLTPAVAGVALCAVLVLAAVNHGIWQKQQLIAHGRPVFVALQPVDPRSLMQGDYMALEFLPSVRTNPDLMAFAEWGKLPSALLRLDARGIAQLVQIVEPQERSQITLTADEVLVELVARGGRLKLVTDAYYFPEGEAERWSRARYGEFRVAADGQALLVALRGENLEPL